MKNLSNIEFRKAWFDFWKSKDHDIIESAPLVPINDPTLLWINAGVTPLKKYFDGSVIPNNRRIANIQKCIRTNDIENVGLTARHGTFFEMMGNFSIGDYFKKEALNYSWEFLTKYLEFDANRLYVTIYPEDHESYSIWKEIGLPDDHIIKLEGNFWEIGVGPSGPDSEIFYDRGRKYDPDNIGIKLLIDDIENDRYVEIWNNVFSMYNANPAIPRSEYEELPSKNIDTGMGFERMLMVLQDKENIYETDVFMPVIKKLEEVTQIRYTDQIAFRVIADHIRALTFALADGASFGNTGRDYVLRRLLRRAVRYGRKIGLNKPFMGILVPTVIGMMKDAYPNLTVKEKIIIDKVYKEEELFHETLIQGEKKFNEIINNNVDNVISGEDAFKLYDTYGFPFELTLEMAKDLGYRVSREEFEEQMKKQQELARNSREKANSMNMQNEELLNFKEQSNFVGYDELRTSTKILALFDGEKFVDSLSEGYLVLENTPFYAEAGGQVSDSGYLLIDGKNVEVSLVFKGPNKQHFHYVKTDFQIEKNMNLEAVVDENIRKSTMRNHSAAHLLQKVLKEVLSDSVSQAGSRIDNKTLRFDFIYENKISVKELLEIEEKVNNKIKLNEVTKTTLMNLDEAIENGATALFEDKYEKVVRVVDIADSKELCGGTHVRNVSDIGMFAIKSFESKGNNTYRIEAATADNISSELFEAIKPYNDEMMKLLSKARKIISKALEEEIILDFEFAINNDAPLSYKDVIYNMNEMDNLKKQVQNLEKRYNDLKLAKAISNLEIFENMIEESSKCKYLVTKLYDYHIDVLKGLVAELANRHDNLFIFIANVTGSNVNYISKGNGLINSGEVVRNASLKSNGNGGGSVSYAQGGGTDITKLDEIIIEIKNIVINLK